MTRENASPVLLTEENPWPALSPFDEASQLFFNGREDETAVLQRAVRQAPLTVLFGKSGLGKTSLLRAGLFPRLRAENYLPVYVRFNVQDRAQPLIDQLTSAFFNEMDLHDLDAPPLAARETLWRYLHRIDFEAWNSQNHLVTPFFVLDQFEEVFTLGGDNKAAVAQLRVDLADLVENRIPAALVALSEKSDIDAKKLDFQRQSYKLLISFREDFLPAIEGWKREMPSLLRNRVRLLAMTGEQAFAAVHNTAPKLVNPDIATEIVRFVAAVQSTDDQTAVSLHPGPGPAVQTVTSGENNDLKDLIVEPALLSLVCHGLNERRMREHKAAFDAALLKGTGRAIIDEFYERCVSDLPERVQRFMENELITERGFRKPCALDDARSGYGITDDDLLSLVNRRLLRIEPSSGIDRVELIHDVLAPVVRQRREQQRNIARRAEAEKEEIRKRQKRKYQLLAGSVVILLIVLVIVTWLANQYLNLGQEAMRLQREEREQRLLAEHRHEQIRKSLRIRQAALSGDYEEVEKLLTTVQKNSTVRFRATQEYLHYKNQDGKNVYKYRLFPDPATLPQGDASIAFITYLANHPTFYNTLMTAGVNRNFTATYIGWGCLTRIVALIEYQDPDKTATVAVFDMCAVVEEK